jgi:hypothetical protein
MGTSGPASPSTAAPNTLCTPEGYDLVQIVDEKRIVFHLALVSENQ